MKKYILMAGVLGVFSLYAGCSSDEKSPLAPVDDSGEAVESSSSAKATSSSAKSDKKSSSSEKASSADSKKSSTSSKDTTTIHQQVVINEDGERVATTYPSSGIFCWNEGCESQFGSSSSAAPSSSESIVITVSSESSEPPEVNGNTMKDKRDNKTYQLKSVGGKLWMAQDLNYETSNSKCFNDENSNCDKYGRLYNYSAATRACPQGWKLPSREEAQTLLNADDYPWSYSGRCKTGECGFTGDMGFHWTTATPQNGDKNYAEGKESNAVILVEKAPDYGDKDDDKKFFQVDDKDKFFSVRCVQE